MHDTVNEADVFNIRPCNHPSIHPSKMNENDLIVNNPPSGFLEILKSKNRWFQCIPKLKEPRVFITLNVVSCVHYQEGPSVVF